jgi:hypothetical protein
MMAGAHGLVVIRIPEPWVIRTADRGDMVDVLGQRANTVLGAPDTPGMLSPVGLRVESPPLAIATSCCGPTTLAVQSVGFSLVLETGSAAG